MANVIPAIYRKGGCGTARLWDCPWPEPAAGLDSVLGLGQPVALPHTLLHHFLWFVRFSPVLLQECNELPRQAELPSPVV